MAEYEQIIERANQHFSNEQFIDAYNLFYKSFALITSDLSYASTNPALAKGNSWVALLFGFHVWVAYKIARGVNKALLGLYGIDLKKCIEYAVMSLTGMITCVLEIPPNVFQDRAMLLNFYLMLCKIAISQDEEAACKDILSLVKPLIKDEMVVSLLPKLSREKIEKQLIETMFKAFPDRDGLNKLLFVILIHLSEDKSELFAVLNEVYVIIKDESSEKMDVPNAKAILGIPANISSVTKEDLHSYWKNKIKEYHPDKYNKNPKEFIELAEEKSKEINQAYEFLLSYIKK